MSAIGSQSFTDNLTTKTITDINNQTGTPGQVLSSTANGIDWVTSSVQPVQQSGTLSGPIGNVPFNNIPYVAGFNRYVTYMTAPPASGAAITHQFFITNCPLNLPDTNTITGSTEWINVGIPGTIVYPLIIDTITIIKDPFPPTIVSEIVLQSTSTVSPVFLSGVPVLKFIININLD